jgi:hypothetical protein
MQQLQLKIEEMQRIRQLEIKEMQRICQLERAEMQREKEES